MITDYSVSPVTGRLFCVRTLTCAAVLVLAFGMHDLKLEEAGKIARPAPPILRTGACTASEITFTANLQRAINLLVIPSWAFIAHDRWRRATKDALRDLFGSEYTDAQLKENWDAIQNRADFHLSEQEHGSDIEQRREFTMARRDFGRVARHCGGLGIHEAFEELLQSVIIQTWTAFESMTEDLHKRTRLHHPSCFSAKALAENYSFRSEHKLIYAYETAFNDPAISSAAWNSESKALAMVRHLLIHKRGIVDDKFVNQCAGQDHKGKIVAPIVTDFLTYPIGSKILIDGVLVRSLIDKLVIAGYRLISAVDDWIK